MFIEEIGYKDVNSKTLRLIKQKWRNYKHFCLKTLILKLNYNRNLWMHHILKPESVIVIVFLSLHHPPHDDIIILSTGKEYMFNHFDHLPIRWGIVGEFWDCTVLIEIELPALYDLCFRPADYCSLRHLELSQTSVRYLSFVPQYFNTVSTSR